MEARKGRQAEGPFQFITQSIKWVLFSIILLSAYASINHLDLSPYFPINTVRVFGVNHVDQQEVQTLLMPLVKRGFFTVDVTNIRDHLLQLPWVSDISVRKGWPNNVDVTIIEKSAIAKWNSEGLLSANAEVFAPNSQTYPEHLPIFVGPTGTQVTMLENYQHIRDLLAPLKINVSQLELSPFYTWKMTLDNGITLQMGHKEILTRLEHFVKVYPKIVGHRADTIDYVDLRYPNGVAVRFKSTIKT